MRTLTVVEEGGGGGGVGSDNFCIQWDKGSSFVQHIVCHIEMTNVSL